jgi:hypothetical protein
VRRGAAAAAAQLSNAIAAITADPVANAHRRACL